MTVAEMTERLSHAEYVQWAAYYSKKAQQVELERLKGG